MSIQLNDWLSKCLLAIIPIMMAGLTTLAWQNSQAVSAFALKLDVYQKEVEHHRVLIEQKMGCK